MTEKQSMPELRTEVEFLWRIINASQIAHIPQPQFNALIESLGSLTLAAKSPGEAAVREIVTTRCIKRLLDIRNRGQQPKS